MKRGVVIAMNPQTGEILAMVSLPTYDNNLFARGISDGRLREAAQEQGQAAAQPRDQAHYAPGSTYKLVAGTGALADRQDHAVDAGQTKAYLTLGDTKFYDWNRRGWGACNIYCGFGHSSDTFFYQVAGMLGIDRLGYWAKQYGFGAPTGDRPARRGRRHRPDERVEAGRPRRRRSSRARPTRPASARATTP